MHRDTILRCGVSVLNVKLWGILSCPVITIMAVVLSFSFVNTKSKSVCRRAYIEHSGKRQLLDTGVEACKEMHVTGSYVFTSKTTKSNAG